ncbi:flippase-like domain-containing protein [Frankia sp. CNm7]|uniref:Flippase-like domain-containing protein n=2 Tax=Frankia nepalensis TaxID=1836974 RepID=A0A937RN02_9ACTN|nr:flippase-like domain-containing protein [Frankia nepalensis]MBL7513957.1 flippase-like domain-containing protein [Frankia nepalensis]MBL7519922.1 flippase-like domain-containing protein [Frankia nepalensis]MBL7633067.1 flippase-like domain-containing protein [Frankia nepalensis]
MLTSGLTMPRALAVPLMGGATGAGGTVTLPAPRRRAAARPRGAAGRALDCVDLDLTARLRARPRLPRRRTLLLGVILGVPLAMLAFRFRSDVERQLADVPAPDWPWLILCGFGATMYYVTNGVALRAGSGLPLGVRVTTAVQCAAAAANRIIPAGIGAVAVNLRFLERRGLPRSAGLATIASTKVVCGLVHLAAIALVAALVGDSQITSALTGPLRDTVTSLGLGPSCVAAAGVAAAVGVPLARRGVRERLRGPLKTFWTHLRELARSPGRASVLATSLAGTKVAQVIALTASARAFGGEVGVLSVAAVYLVGSAVAGAAPTAGNVGAIEPALAIGLAAAGGAAGPMVAAVLVYRLIGYWLPVVPGVIALTALRRRGDL